MKKSSIESADILRHSISRPSAWNDAAKKQYDFRPCLPRLCFHFSLWMQQNRIDLTRGVSRPNAIQYSVACSAFLRKQLGAPADTGAREFCNWEIVVLQGVLI